MSTIYKRLLKDSSSMSTGVMYGVINGVMLIPVTISFCSIIYRDQGFEAYLPQLVKLVMFSSMIHQWAFTYFSSLPFAIGQVQDAGLIFLSAMAADIVQGCQKEEQIVPTTIVILPLCTFILGCMLVVVAKLRLATVIQYLPMPVIGGYLAFIGFFCGQAGLGMMAGVQVTNITEWGNFYSERALILLAPGVVLGITTYLLLCKIRSPYVLPCCMLGILTLFFGLLFLAGMSLDDARAYGWISPLAHPEPFYHSWALYDFSLVDWSMFPQQFLRLVGMFLVVAFSSSLDVAAIEMEMGLPLDYNRELNTVGIANMFSGITGGYTGSYIFSQTIFTMRRGVYSRVNGYTVVLCEGLMILLPISVISYLPKLFFGSLLVLISTDLMMEWLVAARLKMAPTEFAVCLLTFFAIQATGIEIGMFIGILLAMASFVVSYSSLQAVSSASLQSSTVVRTFEERASLIANRGKVVTITLKGYIFFGSAVKILEDVKSHVTISVPDLTPQELMRLQEQQQIAAKLAEIVQASSTSTGETVGETSPLLGQSPSKNHSGNSDPGFGALHQHTPIKHDVPRMSFRMGPASATAGKGTAPSQDVAIKTAGTASAAKRLFPEATGVSLGSSDAQRGLNFMAEAPPAHLSSLPAHHASSSMSVYDMSPETLQLLIEERHCKDGSELYGSFTAREHSTGAHAPHSWDPPTGNLAAPIAAADIEMGKVSAGTGRGIASSSPEKVASQSGKRDGSHPVRPLPYRKHAKVPASATATVAASIENNWLQEEIKRQQGQSSQTHQGSALRRVSFDGEVPPAVSESAAGLPCDISEAPSTVSGSAEAKPESLLAIVFDQQCQHHHRSGPAPDIPSMPSATVRMHPGESVASILRTPSRDSSGGYSSGVDDRPQPEMVRERSFQEQYDANKRRPSKTTEKLHLPNNPPPEVVLSSMGVRADLSNDTAVSDEADNMTEYLVLDFSSVVGVDATATRSCFLMLVQLMRSANVTVVFACMSPALEALFRAHKVIGEKDVVIPLLDDALEWCEERVLIRAGQTLNKPLETAPKLERNPSFYSRALKQRQQLAHKQSRSSRSNSESFGEAAPSGPTVTAQQDLCGEAKALCRILEDYLEVDASSSTRLQQLLCADLLARYFQRVTYPPFETLFDAHQQADKVYFIESGEVEIVTVASGDLGPSPAPSASASPARVAAPATTAAPAGAEESEGLSVARVNKVYAGGAFGEADFFLGKNHSVQAHTMVRSVFWTMDRAQYARMEVESPALCLLVQHSLLKSLAIASTCALYAQHPSTTYAGYA